MRILIKYATRGRQQKFVDAMQNIQSTISRQADYLVVVSIDSDDVSMLQVMSKYTFLNTVFHVGARTNKIGAINRDLNHVHEDWDLLINFSDDMKFVVPDWDRLMIESIRDLWAEGTDFFAHFSDGYVKEKLPTMSIMGREYYERFYYVYPPCYKSVSCDAEAMYVAMMLGRHHYFADVLFKHEHPANVKGKMDLLYQENNKYEKEDTETYFRRLNKNFYVHNPGPTPFDKFKAK